MSGHTGGNSGPLKTLRVGFMGGFALEYNKKSVRLAQNYTGKAMQLLVLLLYRDGAGVSRDELKEVLYGGTEVDSGNCLKALLFRLRQKIAESELKGVIRIEYGQGNYRIAGQADMISDVAVFEQRTHAALHGGARRREALQQACEAYGGELLPQISAQDWVIAESARLGSLFQSVASALLDAYMIDGAFPQAYALAKRGILSNPANEGWYIGAIKSLLLQGKRSQAFDEFQSATRVIEETAGTQTAWQFARRVSAMLENPMIPEQSSGIVHALGEPESQPGRVGAYACTYPGFIDSFRALSRIMLRDGVTSSLLVCSLQARQKEQPTDGQDVAMEALSQAINSALRPSDLVTRCGPTQMLALLWDTPVERAGDYLKRVERAFARQTGRSGWKCRLACLALPAGQPPQS